MSGREEEEEKKAPCTIYSPFSQKLQAPKKGTTNVEVYKLFEQVKISIPLLDAIKQIFAYAKFLKTCAFPIAQCKFRKKHF